MVLLIEPVDLKIIIDNVISITQPMAFKNNISIENQATPESRISIEADPLMFKQVVLNLVSNAIKYNKPNGSVVISYDRIEKGILRLGVRDTGKGIPSDKMGNIFKPFDRLGLEGGAIEGTGIGLTISKKLIEMMNGTIGFSSTLGEGSFFYLEIPVSKFDYPPVSIENTSSAIKPQIIKKKSKKVLYIDDISTNLVLVDKFLSNHTNLEFLSASNALDGIEKAKTRVPDLILMDIHMPDMNGFDAFKKLKLIEETKNIPIIALTADAMDRNIKKALDMGFRDYITKPINLDVFLTSILRVI